MQLIYYNIIQHSLPDALSLIKYNLPKQTADQLDETTWLILTSLSCVYAPLQTVMRLKIIINVRRMVARVKISGTQWKCIGNSRAMHFNTYR